MFWMIVCGLLYVDQICRMYPFYRDVDQDGTVYGGPMYYHKRTQRCGCNILGKISAVLFTYLYWDLWSETLLRVIRPPRHHEPILESTGAGLGSGL